MNPITIAKYADKIRSLSSGGAGTGAEITCALAAAGRVRSFSINAAGSGYAEGDVLTCDSATFTVITVDGSGAVTEVELTTAGTTVTTGTAKVTTVAPEGGTGAKLNLVAEFGINTTTIVEGGTDYITATAVLTGGTGTGGEITFEFTEGVITTATVAEAGWYLTAPSIAVVAGPPADDTAWLTLLTAFDATFLYERLLEVLGNEKVTVVIDPRAETALSDLRTTLLAG